MLEGIYGRWKEEENGGGKEKKRARDIEWHIVEIKRMEIVLWESYGRKKFTGFHPLYILSRAFHLTHKHFSSEFANFIVIRL